MKMSLRTVLMSFVACIFFNIILNSFDVYSDIALAVKTLTFDLGESILLSGCRVCHGKTNKDVFSVRNDSCHHCLTKNDAFRCGMSFEMLTKLNEIEKTKTCRRKRFGVAYNMKSKRYESKSDSCSDVADTCCFETKQQNKVMNPLDKVDKTILALQTHRFMDIRDDSGVDIFLLSSKSSNFHCSNVFDNHYLIENLTTLKRSKDNEGFFKFSKSTDGKYIIEEGFDSTDDCGVYIISKQERYVGNNGESCGMDSCLIHLQSIKLMSNISDIDEWKEKPLLGWGIKFGGQVCHLLWIYGLASLVPILMNSIFNLFVYFEDLKSGNATKIDVIFVVISVYPQFKCLKFLLQFLLHKDETKLNKDMTDYENQLGSLEPFLESTFQVSFQLFFYYRQ